ncbi:SGNH/GDSL hydrolase family protein [Altericroceibacterium endophyticum]|uniref:SGNH hydrolase-type esterase domain-containing protein n=1 Tax=Altericroceibacterium endophyticum TaxID=1808508 RepID=A0A6I4SZG9_9SPHN|nr:SGNH/GDSL hydrolase family protein [Altericroceibacterium endophyticum]MXO64154.1 hypothetical protein [Altericroceibacterium endophyticum]
MSTDIIARGLAARSREDVQGIARRATGCIGTRIAGGRMFKVFSLASGVDAGLTFELTMAIAPPEGADAFRFLMCLGQTTPENSSGLLQNVSMNGSVTTLGGMGNADLSNATWTRATVGGEGDWTMQPPQTYGRRSYQWSDWLPVPSMERTDGDKHHLLTARVYLYQTTGASAPVVLWGHAADNFENHASHPSGRVWRTIYRSGSCAAANQNTLNLTTGSPANGGPIVGFQYAAAGKVVNLVGFGDSICEGRASYIGDGFGAPAAAALSKSDASASYEWSNLGWTGQTSAQIGANLADALEHGILGPQDIAIIPGGSPNDQSSFTPASIANMRGQRGKSRARLSEANVPHILYTQLPIDPVAKLYGASDALRRSDNDRLRKQAQHGDVVADFASAFTLSENDQGQSIPKPNYMQADGVHPNDAGNAAAGGLLATAVSEMLRPAAGKLVR